jgi:hypothetical protein
MFNQLHQHIHKQHLLVNNPHIINNPTSNPLLEVTNSHMLKLLTNMPNLKRIGHPRQANLLGRKLLHLKQEVSNNMLLNHQLRSLLHLSQ